MRHGRLLRPETSGWRSAAAVVAGGAGGLSLWTAFALSPPALPVSVRFAFALSVLLAGSGAALAFPLLRRVDPLSRLILPFSLGIAAMPVVYHGLEAVGLQAAHPYLAAAVAGGYLTWFFLTSRSSELPARSVAGALMVAGLAAALGVAAFGHAISVSEEGIVVRGDYDAYDLSYYAALAGELTHTVPPRSPFNAGSGFTHAYYPHLIAAVVHGVGDVSLFDLYFRYLWPAFLVVLALTAFVFVRAVSSVAVAVLAVTLLLVGSDLSYLAVWLLRPSTSTFDDVIWSVNFQSPSAEPLLFNNWTPALVLVFVAFYAMARDEDDPWLGWRAAAALSIAVLLQFKPFAWLALLGGLGLTALLSRRDPVTRRRHLATAGAALVASVPLGVQIMRGAADAQARLVPGLFLLPQVTLTKIGLAGTLRVWAAGLGLTGLPQEWMVTGIGLVIFLVGGLGFRLLGVGAAWRDLRGRGGAGRPVWRLLAATIVTAVAIPCVARSVPYHETLQFHQMALFLLPVFVARSLVTGWTGWRRAALVSGVIAIAVPSTLHYLVPKWTAPRTFARISAGELEVAAYLRTLDPRRTVVLHRDSSASLLGIATERRSVLAWARYVPDSPGRRREVSRFFDGRDRPLQVGLDVLGKYGVTHVVERGRLDRIHPRVRQGLTVVMKSGGVTLYAVPPLP